MPTTIKIAGERTVLFTQKEAADFLGVTERTMRNYVKSGRIPACTVRRRVYIWDKHLQQFLRGARTTRTYKPVPPPQYDSIEYDNSP